MNMNNRRLKVNFWGKYEDELRFAEKENNKKRIRELFALSYVNYLDSVLTPVENFGIRNEAFQELSFKENFIVSISLEEQRCIVILVIGVMVMKTFMLLENQGNQEIL